MNKTVEQQLESIMNRRKSIPLADARKQLGVVQTSLHSACQKLRERGLIVTGKVGSTVVIYTKAEADKLGVVQHKQLPTRASRTAHFDNPIDMSAGLIARRLDLLMLPTRA